MANRNFPSQRLFSFHMLPVAVDAKVAIGAVGAVGTIDAPGVASVVRDGVGLYTITLSDVYAELNGFFGSVLHATLSGIVGIELVSEAVSSTKAIQIKCLDAAGAAADPADGSKLFLFFLLNNSKVQ